MGSGDPSGLQNRRDLALLGLVSSTLTRFRQLSALRLVSRKSRCESAGGTGERQKQKECDCQDQHNENDHACGTLAEEVYRPLIFGVGIAGRCLLNGLSQERPELACEAIDDYKQDSERRKAKEADCTAHPRTTSRGKRTGEPPPVENDAPQHASGYGDEPTHGTEEQSHQAIGHSKGHRDTKELLPLDLISSVNPGSGRACGRSPWLCFLI